MLIEKKLWEPHRGIPLFCHILSFWHSTFSGLGEPSILLPQIFSNFIVLLY